MKSLLAFINTVPNIRHWSQNLTDPGLDLHTRNRVSLCNFSRDALDVGSSNGHFSCLTYNAGARVVAINIGRPQVENAPAFAAIQKTDPDRFQFEHRIVLPFKCKPHVR